MTSPKKGKNNKKSSKRTTTAGPKSFEKVKKELFKSLPNSQFTPGWPTLLRKDLKKELHKADKNNV